MNIRMLPPSNPQYQTRIVNGRTYTGLPGTTVDVPDFDASMLEGANLWVRVAPSGPTSARPSGEPGGPPYPAYAGVQFFDTTLGALIVFDGAAWRNPANGASV